MRKLSLMLLCASLCTLAFVVPTAPALAQARVWVNNPAATPPGNDSTCAANNQSLPCATFAQALTLAGTGGEVNCLSDGDYGTVTISAPVTIDCGSNTGNITQTSSTLNGAINITTGGNVTLRKLALNGFGTGAVGINVTSGTGTSVNLLVDNCIIDGFNNSAVAAGIGIAFSPGGTASRNSLTVLNTTITGSINTQSIGILVSPFNSDIVSLSLVGDVLGNNYYGVYINCGSGVIAGVVVDSRVVENQNNGITVSGNSTFITIDGSTIADNLGTGIASQSAGANVAVNNSTITGNATGVSGSATSSFKNNRLFLNGTNGTFGSTQSLQ